MKKVIVFTSAALFICMSSCNNASEKTDPLKAKADSLEKEVIKGHDIAMPKSMKIPDVQKALQKMIDSIATLPGKAKDAAAPLKAKLEEAVNELNYADNAMNKWMAEINFDSAVNNMQERINYFAGEKLKVDKVKDAVFSSLAKADSLLKKKF